ncbi:MAG: phage portal protein [Solobacterium sp.]|nr:phage portal protein [Solobacterium sp.]
MGIFDIFKRSKTKYSGDFKPYDINTWSYRSFDGNALNIDLVRACVDALARNIAKMSLRPIVMNKDGTTTVDNISDIAKVLKHPNQYMTMYDFLYKVSAMYYLNNNAFIYPEYDEKGYLVALHPINYSTFKLYELDNKLYASFRLRYTRTYTIAYDRIIHLRNHFIQDDLMGDANNALYTACELIGAQNQGIINGIKNSAIIRGILKTINVIKDEDLEKAKQRFIKDNLSAQNNGGVIAVDGKFDYQNIESKPYIVDSATMDQAKNKIFSYFGVNEEFLQNKFTSEQYEAVYEGRLEPFAILLTDSLTYALYTERERGFGNEIEVNMSRLKYQPTATIVNVISATKELGLFTRDDYRSMLGYTPLGHERGGDEIMIATNNYVKESDIKSTEEDDGKEYEE